MKNTETALERKRVHRKRLEYKLQLLEQQIRGEICLTCHFSSGAFGNRTECAFFNTIVSLQSTCLGWKR